MKAIVVKLECLTNLHVGNGDVNYNIIDNEVELDPVTKYPIINSSGVKGALRIFLKGQKNVDDWFGAEGDTKQGKLKILAANMLAMPVRATAGDKAYYLVTTEDMMDYYHRLSEALNFKDELLTASVTSSGKEVEGVELKHSQKFEGKELYTVTGKEFREFSLPVIVRNKLEEGKSKNLWYEQVVPHESIFYFPVLAEDADESLLKAFKNAVSGKVIQFGGNASIGYGLCKVTVGDSAEE